ILYTLVPLMRDVGIEAEWQVIYGREEFFNATKLMHNALQGSPQDLSPEEWDTWEQYNEMNARELTEGWDFCVVHDPQPAAMHSLVAEKASSRWWARWPPTTRRGGTSSTRPSPMPRATPTCTYSTTSTTSARSRSTPFSPTPMCSCRRAPARGSA